MRLIWFAAPANAQMTVTPRWTEESPSRPNALPLEQEQVAITIDEQHATTVVTQQYLNQSDETLEAVCAIQAGQNAKVRGFAYWNGERKIKGEVFEKEDASQVYSQTTGTGRDPGLAEQTGEGSFSFRVFPIQSREHKRIEITLAQRLARTGTHVEYRLPLAHPAALISVSLMDSRSLGAFVSPTHDIELETFDGRLNIKANAKTKQVKEFVLNFDVQEAPYKLSVVRHQDPGQPAYLAISMATEALSQRSPKDVTIVLDRSGSMSGTPLNEARAAAKEIVARLSGQDRLNVIAFDDQVQALYSHMEPVTDVSRASAQRFLDGVVDGGGTDIALALREALEVQRANADRPIVLLLTDGASDANAVFTEIEKNSSNVRVFTVGLGPGVNRPLLARLADMRRGKFTYIQSAEAIRASITRLFGSIETAVLRTPQLTMENGELLQLQPSTLPDLAPGEELLVTARATGKGPARIMLDGVGSHGPVHDEVALQLGDKAAHAWVGQLWAAERTNHVLEDISLKGETEERKTEVVELAIAYGFVTSYTSFLAIPEEELTESTTQLLSEMRERKRNILAKRKDAVALSRSEMPPGDPVLSVDAPANARRVTAFFPFGLEKDLDYDAETGTWRVRFLVPKGVPDGKYEVPVVVVTRDGQFQTLTGHYTIDSQEPEFEVAALCTGNALQLSVETHEPMREIWAALVSRPSKRVRFAPDPQNGTETRYVAKLQLEAGGDRVRVVVTDKARNEAEEVVVCTQERQ
jgi:Ca-activated chloride channel homolog